MVWWWHFCSHHLWLGYDFLLQDVGENAWIVILRLWQCCLAKLITLFASRPCLLQNSINYFNCLGLKRLTSIFKTMIVEKKDMLYSANSGFYFVRSNNQSREKKQRNCFQIRYIGWVDWWMLFNRVLEHMLLHWQTKHYPLQRLLKRDKWGQSFWL